MNVNRKTLAIGVAGIVLWLVAAACGGGTTNDIAVQIRPVAGKPYPFVATGTARLRGRVEWNFRFPLRKGMPAYAKDFIDGNATCRVRVGMNQAGSQAWYIVEIEENGAAVARKADVVPLTAKP